MSIKSFSDATSDVSPSWVLIAFKREFPFHDVLRLWEVLWTDYYSNNFVLFIALAILESHRDMILRYLVEVRSYILSIYQTNLTLHTLQFDEILKVSIDGSGTICPNECDLFIQYCNELSMTIELDSTLAQAEVLFLSYAQFVADIDRRRAEESSQSSSTSGLIHRQSTANSDIVGGKKVNIALPTLSENIRELLKAGR